MAAAPAAGAHDCQCRYSGQKYDQGATVCMRGKVAQCDMYLNNSSWKLTTDACPLALPAEPEGPRRQVAITPAPVLR